MPVVEATRFWQPANSKGLTPRWKFSSGTNRNHQGPPGTTRDQTATNGDQRRPTATEVPSRPSTVLSEPRRLPTSQTISKSQAKPSNPVTLKQLPSRCKPFAAARGLCVRILRRTSQFFQPISFDSFILSLAPFATIFPPFFYLSFPPILNPEKYIPSVAGCHPPRHPRPPLRPRPTPIAEAPRVHGGKFRVKLLGCVFRSGQATHKDQGGCHARELHGAGRVASTCEC